MSARPILSADMIAKVLIASVRAAGLPPAILLESFQGRRNPTGLAPARAAACNALKSLSLLKPKTLRALCLPDMLDQRAAVTVAPSSWTANKVYERCYDAAMTVVKQAHVPKTGVAVPVNTAKIHRMALQLTALRAQKTRQNGLGTKALAMAPPSKPTLSALTSLPPIPPVVCGSQWTREYIAERERIQALHRLAAIQRRLSA